MANYQNSAMVNANTILAGGFALYYATTAGGSFTNMGLGRAFTVTEEISKFTSQSSNGPDPIEGVARQEVVITFELLETTPATWDAIRGGSLDTENASTASTYITGTPTANTISSGGLTELVAKAYKFVNNTLVSGATTMSVFVVYKAYVDAGLSFTATSDNSDDPVTVWPFTIRAQCDAGRTKGDQLWKFETELGA